MWMSNRPAAPQSNIWKFLQKLHKYSLAQCSRDWAFNSLPTDGRAWQCFDGFEPSAIISGAADAIDAIFAIAHNFLHPLDSMICLCPLRPLTPDGRNISPRNIAIQWEIPGLLHGLVVCYIFRSRIIFSFTKCKLQIIIQTAKQYNFVEVKVYER